MTALEQLTSLPRIVTLDAEGAAAFLRAKGPGLLLVPGDPSRAEVADVVVVLRELAALFPHFRIGVTRASDDPVMRVCFGVPTLPALLFVRDGAVKRTLTRMHSWSTYVGTARALEQPS